MYEATMKLKFKIQVFKAWSHLLKLTIHTGIMGVEYSYKNFLGGFEYLKYIINFLFFFKKKKKEMKKTEKWNL